jgi:hypothetical protein
MTGVAGGVMYVVYMFPYALVDLLIPLPRQVGTGMFSFFLFLSLPAIVYSAVFALVITLVVRVKNSRFLP